MKNLHPVKQALTSLAGQLKDFMPMSQRTALIEALTTEERDGIAELINNVVNTIETMPKSYETDGMESKVVVYLHYFKGSVDAWITEKDIGDGDDTTQYQAFGRICITGNTDDAELGYISIQELIENGVELDLYWKPVTLGEL